MITSRSNIFPGYNIVKRGREVKIKDTGKVIKPVWGVNKFLEAITHKNDAHVNSHINKLMDQLERDAKRMGFNALASFDVSVKPCGEFASVVMYEITIMGILCQIEKT